MPNVLWIIILPVPAYFASTSIILLHRIGMVYILVSKWSGHFFISFEGKFEKYAVLENKRKKASHQNKQMYVSYIYVYKIYLGNMVFRNPALVSPESLSLRELSHRGPRDKKFEVPKLENNESQQWWCMVTEHLIIKMLNLWHWK